MKKFICFAALVGLMCSCSKQAYKTHTARTIGVSARVDSFVNVADLDVSDQKQKGECSDKMLTKKQKEQNAIALALEATRSDVLVEPQFTYDYNKKGKLVKVTVWGYPARYRNFRSTGAAVQE